MTRPQAIRRTLAEARAAGIPTTWPRLIAAGAIGAAWFLILVFGVFSL